MDITRELKKDRNQNHPDFDTLLIYFSQITVPVLTFALKVARPLPRTGFAQTRTHGAWRTEGNSAPYSWEGRKS